MGRREKGILEAIGGSDGHGCLLRITVMRIAVMVWTARPHHHRNSEVGSASFKIKHPARLRLTHLSLTT
jgi:hypothetical protein